MKKIILFAIAVLLFAACKKSSNGALPANTITATIDGTTYTFSKVFLDSQLVDGSSHIFVAEFTYDTTAASSKMVVAVIDTVAIVNKTYTDTTANPQAAIEFTFDGTTVYENAGVKAHPARVSINSISATSVQGTFQGTLYVKGDSAKNKIEVTDGRFNLSK